MSHSADTRSGIASLRVRVPHELLGARAAGTLAVLQGAGGGVSRHRGLHTEASRGERAAEDSLLPGGAGVLHQGDQTGSTQGRNPDHKESTLVRVYRVSERCSVRAFKLVFKGTVHPQKNAYFLPSLLVVLKKQI